MKSEGYKISRATYAIIVVSIICLINYFTVSYWINFLDFKKVVTAVNLTTDETTNYYNEIIITTNTSSISRKIKFTTSRPEKATESPNEFELLFDDPELYEGPSGKSRIFPTNSNGNMWYILTTVLMLHTTKAGQNMLFRIFRTILQDFVAKIMKNERKMSFCLIPKHLSTLSCYICA